MSLSGKFLSCIALVVLWIPFSGKAQTPIQNQINIWPGTAPGSANVTVTEEIDDRNPNGGDCYLNRAVRKVVEPTIKVFEPANPNGKAVLICPGGGYALLAYDKEGYNIAQWYNERDITAFVLKYRLPIDGHDNRKYVPLQDAQRAMRFIRANAQTYNIHPDSIGIMGGSAGGHLAASLSVFYDWEVYAPVDSVDSLSARPNFTVLMYPVISFQDSLTHGGSRSNLLGTVTEALKDSFSAELHVDANTPPAFLFHSKKDGSVTYRNSTNYALALDNAGVNYSLNLYETGDHGVGKCEAGTSDFASWPLDLDAWLVQEGWTTECQGTPVSVAVSPTDTALLIAGSAASYQWYRNGVAISGATDSTFSASQSGYYSVATNGQRSGSQTDCEVFSDEQAIDICPGAVPEISVNGNKLISSRGGNLQWYLNGQALPGVKNRTITVTDTGSYQVVSINTLPISGEECRLFSEAVLVDQLTGLEDLATTGARLYPNPVDSELVVDRLHATFSTWQIIDLTGKVVRESGAQLNGGEIRVNVADLPAGIYQFVLYSDESILQGRFSKVE